MSLTVWKKPEILVGANYCRFNSVNNKMLFKMTRKDFNVSITESVTMPGFVKVTISDVGVLATGDFVYLSSGIYANGAYEVGTVDVSSNSFLLPTLVFISNSTSGYVNSDTIRKYYYVEFQLVIDGKNYYVKGLPDSEGIIKIDVSGVLRRLVNTENDNPYKFYAGDYLQDENMLKEFTYQIREKWNGSTQSWFPGPDTFYGVNAAIDCLQNSIMHKYTVFQDSTRVERPEIMTKFNVLTWFFPYFFDYSLLFGQAIVTINEYWYDINKVFQSGISSNYTITEGLRRVELNSGITLTAYLDTVKHILIRESGTYFKEKWVNVNRDCVKNPVYISWLNDVGGREYWLFSSENKVEIDSKNSQTVMAVSDSSLEQNKKEFNILGRANKRIQIVQDNLPISELEGWLDFLRQENVYVLKAKLWDNDVSIVDIGGGKCRITCKENHNLIDADKIRFYFDPNYDLVDYPVTIISDYVFEITRGYIAQMSTIIWRKQLTDKDWISCVLVNKSEPIKQTPTAFAIKFDLIFPGFARKLM